LHVSFWISTIISRKFPVSFFDPIFVLIYGHNFVHHAKTKDEAIRTRKERVFWIRSSFVGGIPVEEDVVPEEKGVGVFEVAMRFLQVAPKLFRSRAARNEVNDGFELQNVLRG
jgi:hypothetical protein